MNRTQFLSAMMTDFNMVADYFNDPEAVLSRVKVSAAERAAFVARDIDALAAIGIDRRLVSAALSGAHSSTCPSPIPN